MGAGFGMTYGLYLLGRRYPRVAFWLGLSFAVAFLAASVPILVWAYRTWDFERLFVGMISALVGIVLIYNVWPLRQRIRRERELRSLRAR
jgi:hydrogenase/urease accessory protein HupE